MIYDWLKHKGHNIVVSTYGQGNDNASIECEDCWEVLASSQEEASV